jgi:Tfp pilus assembly protein PilF
MKTDIIILLVLACAGSLLAIEPRDAYQPLINPNLVRQVDEAKEKQVNGSDLDQAESILSDVLKRQPNYYRALYNLGLVYQSKGENEKAIETLKQAEAIRYEQGIPDNSILNSLGWTYMNGGDLDKAEDYLKAAYATQSENSPVTNERIVNNLGFLYLQKGQTVEARKYLNEAKEKYKSAAAENILKLVADYEKRQNQTQTAAETWAGYGQQPRNGGDWIDRHFDVEGEDKNALPQPNKVLVALDNVYIRTRAPIWDDRLQDFIRGPVIGYIKPGDRIQALEVVDENASDNKNAWYWIRFKRVSKR